MEIIIVGSGGCQKVKQNERTFFSNSSVSRSDSKIINEAVISAGILRSDEELYLSPIQNYKTRENAFKIRKTKKGEILKRTYKKVRLIGTQAQIVSFKSSLTKIQASEILFYSHRKIFFLYLKFLLFNVIQWQNMILICKEIGWVLGQFLKFKVDKPSTGMCATIIAINKYRLVVTKLTLMGIGNPKNKNFFYSSDIDTTNYLWGNIHEKVDQRVIKGLKFCSIQVHFC